MLHVKRSLTVNCIASVVVTEYHKDQIILVTTLTLKNNRQADICELQTKQFVATTPLILWQYIKCSTMNMTYYVKLLNDSTLSMQYLAYCCFMLNNSYLCKKNMFTV